MNRETLVIPSYFLQNPNILQSYREDGYNYVRKYHKLYDNILRAPTVGCYVMLSRTSYPTFFPIDSRDGKKLIKKISYF